LNLLNTEDEEIPWKAIFSLTGEINYGGRVTDDIDRRCILTILSNFLTEKSIAKGYTFSPSGIYLP
jgi:dynein heavy chain